MTLPQPRPYSVRTQFELRKASLSSPRASIVRAFLLDGHWGILDDSGALWPVALHEAVELQHLSVCKVFLRFARGDGQEVTKYQDGGFVCYITGVQDLVVSSASWPASCALRAPGKGGEEPTCYFDAQLILGVREECKRVNLPHCQYLSTTVLKKCSHVRMVSEVLRRVRDYFDNRGFLECDVPYLVPSGGMEAYLTPFETVYEDHRGSKHVLQLPTSPEFALKKLIAAGFSKVFHLGKAYRNKGESSRWHEPEFLLLEWYRTGESLTQIMKDTQGLVENIAKCVGCLFELPARWKVFRVADLFANVLSLDLSKLAVPAQFYEAAYQHSPSLRPSDSWDDIFCKLFMEKIEPILQQERACFVVDYPIQMGALAAPTAPGQPFVQRFEAYLQGVEICNGYFELTDATELLARFKGTEEKCRGNGESVLFALKRDEIFEQIIQYGMPHCAGNALGIERVVAILLGEKNIQTLKAIPFLSQFKEGLVAFE